MKLFLDVILTISAVLSVVLGFASRPTPGGVNANAILELPALFFAIVFVIALLIRVLAY